MGNEVDFMVHGYIPLNIFGHEVWITTTHICLLIVCMFVIAIGIFAKVKISHAAEVPADKAQNLIELYVEIMDNLVKSNLLKYWRHFANYFLTVFMFLVCSNLSGLFGLRPPTADYGVTLPLGFITFVLIQVNAVKYNGAIGYAKSLLEPIPILLPVNLIGEISTPISLSLRLFGNILAGTILMALYYGMLPVIVTIGIPSFLHVYLDLFAGVLQAFVFCMLSMTFIAQKLPE